MKKISAVLLLLLLLVAVVSVGDRAWVSDAAAQSVSAPKKEGYHAQRERLISELQLDVQQQAKLDSITSAMLPKYLALSGLTPAERKSQRARLTTEAQQKINGILTPDQRATYELMQAREESASPATAARSAASAAAGS